MDVGKAVADVKGGKIDFKVDKYGIIHSSVGRVSFDADQIKENATEMLQTINKLKPAASKGVYVKSICVSGTMTPGIHVDPKDI